MENCIVRSVKRIIKIIIALVIIVLLFIGASKIFDYYHIGYSIKNMNVKVDVTNQKQYKVTEEIYAHFNVDKPGISRFISDNVNKGNFTITDVSVDGEEFDVNSTKYKGVTIKIGDQHKKVSGDKKYVIHYTLTNYVYGEESNKNFEFNILENKRDVKVEKFTAQINLPKGFVPVNTTVNKYKVDSEYKYIYKNDNLSIAYNANGPNLSVQSNEPIDRDAGISLKTALNGKCFNNIPSESNIDDKQIMFTSLDRKEKEYTSSSFSSGKIKLLSDKLVIIAGFVIFVFIGVTTSISRRKQLERERRANLKWRREHPYSLYSICCLNDFGDDCCSGNDYYDEK